MSRFCEQQVPAHSVPAEPGSQRFWNVSSELDLPFSGLPLPNWMEMS